MLKTTVELPETLLQEAKRLAVRNRTTVKALIEKGLRSVIEERKGRSRFSLKRASFRGDGLAAGISLEEWERVRDLTYTGRGA